MHEGAPNELRHFPGADQVERAPLAVEERRLTEVDNLNRYRLPDSKHSQWTLDQILDNLIPYVKEGGMPSAVHTVRHRYEATGQQGERGEQLKAYMWLGRTAIQNAESGYAFHKHQAARDRVAVEVEEARDTEANLRPGITKIFISPRMSRADAPYKVAKAEHLGDDDAVRGTTAVTDEHGNIQARDLQSLLVRDIPLESWVSMAEDPNNLFGKAIHIENPESALSIMKAHGQFEVPTADLPEGIVTVVAAVIPYIKDPELRASVQQQVKEFREDQQTKHDRAVNIAMRWRDFEVQLADSLHEERATLPIRRFINNLMDTCSDEERRIIEAHQLPNAHFEMSRKLAAIVEKAQQKTLLVKAGVVSGNQRIIEQMDAATVQRIYRAEITTQVAYASGYRHEIIALEAEQNRDIHNQNLKNVGGGCAGEIDSEDGGNDDYSPSHSLKTKSDEEKKIGKKKWGRCVVDVCPNHSRQVEVGGCGVCLDRCQPMFDKGEDPSRKRAAQDVGRKAVEASKADSHEFSLAA